MNEELIDDVLVSTAHQEREQEEHHVLTVEKCFQLWF